jgi:hypothetical protein
MKPVANGRTQKMSKTQEEHNAWLAEQKMRIAGRMREMKIVEGKIVEATESELLDYYLTRDFDIVVSFETFKDMCKEAGTKVTEEEGESK